MIDTLNLALNDFEISARPQLTVYPHPYQADTGVTSASRPLWSDVNGCPVEGKEARHAAKNFDVTIKAPNPGACPGCYVQLSLPKYHSGNNLYPLDLKESQETIQHLERALCDIGIRTSLKSASLARLDLFRNIEAEEPFESYRSLFPLLKSQQKQQHEWKTTFLWKNTQQQTLIYDKGAEMQQRGYDKACCPTNTIRCEHGFLNGSKIKAVLGGRTVEHLWGEYENLGAIYDQALRQTLFRTPPLPEEDSFAGSHLETEMRSFQKQYKRNWLPAYLQAWGVSTLLEQHGQEAFEKAFTHLIDGNTNSRSQEQRLYRTKRDMNKAALTLASLRNVDSSTKTLGTLYHELQRKLLLTTH